MTDYKDYISFEVDGMADYYDQPAFRLENLGEMSELKGQLRQAVEQSLGEIFSTPEGAAALKQVAALAENGKITFGFHEDGFSFAQKADDEIHVLIGADEQEDKYEAESGDYNYSIQRAVFHELTHFILPEGSEQQVVDATNVFMKKYYNEPPRTDYSGGDSGGTPHWDVNPDFRSEGYDPNNPEITMFGVWQNIGSMWQDFAFGGMSPEIESLYELRNDFDAFQMQWDEVMENGGMDQMQYELNDIIAIEPELVESAIRLDSPAPSAVIDAPQP